MTSDHFQVVLDALVRRTPFRPFTVELVGGQRFEIDHDRAVIWRNGIAIFISPGGTPIWFDHDSVVTFLEDTAGTSA
jgi:hypothetical protein